MTKKKPVDLAKMIEQITDNVVAKLTPKIDGIFDKVMKTVNEEMKDIRSIQANQTQPDQPKTPIAQPKGDLGSQIENLLGSIGQGNIPITQTDLSVQQNPQQNPMQIFELIKMFKMLEGDSTGMGGISPKMMQEIGMRQQISMTNMMNNMFAQFMKQSMTKMGADPLVIKEMELTNEHLMGKVNKLGSANKKAEIESKMKQIIEDKHEKQD